jgi:hypothetical protein
MDNLAILRGSINYVEVKPDGPGFIDLHVSLSLEFVNTRSMPLIFLTAERPYVVGGDIVRYTEGTSAGEKLAGSYFGASRDGSPKWKPLRKSLELPHPPLDKVHILMPNERWPLEGEVQIELNTDKGTQICAGVCPQASWERIHGMGVVWLRAIAVIWPINIEPYTRGGDNAFGHKLQKRWRNDGFLQLHDVISEPIRLDLRGLPLKCELPTCKVN